MLNFDRCFGVRSSTTVVVFFVLSSLSFLSLFGNGGGDIKIATLRFP